MTIIDLQIKAELLNVTALVPDEEETAYNWHFKMRCGSCNETTANFVTINSVEGNQISGSRGDANLVMRCKFCKREASASIVGKPVEYTDADSGKFVRILSLECRGLEPVEFEPRDGWTARGADSKTRFAIDLTEGEWYDYDEEAGLEVSVTEIEHRFERGRGPAKGAK
ncbi:hypothetical protein LPJ61_002194 [Coemansia biformis]|uniref:DUF866-domain-containing protein n=1 Tax=Coemansia biformis TaxID=1286918 RepID=A0A9W8CZE2_9FUNG|nr:hypothetical protein LPJ61_002194 [Coemansia biformis]